MTRPRWCRHLRQLLRSRTLGIVNPGHSRQLGAPALGWASGSGRTLYLSAFCWGGFSCHRDDSGFGPHLPLPPRVGVAFVLELLGLLEGVTRLFLEVLKTTLRPPPPVLKQKGSLMTSSVCELRSLALMRACLLPHLCLAASNLLTSLPSPLEGMASACRFTCSGRGGCAQRNLLVPVVLVIVIA